MTKHELKYRAGSYGLSHLGLQDDIPHWYCSCGGWRKDRDPINGKPFRERAEKLHGEHMKQLSLEEQ